MVTASVDEYRSWSWDLSDKSLVICVGIFGCISTFKVWPKKKLQNGTLSPNRKKQFSQDNKYVNNAPR